MDDRLVLSGIIFSIATGKDHFSFWPRLFNLAVEDFSKFFVGSFCIDDRNAAMKDVDVGSNVFSDVFNFDNSAIDVAKGPFVSQAQTFLLRKFDYDARPLLSNYGFCRLFSFRQGLRGIDQRSANKQHPESSEQCYPKGLRNCISSSVGGGLLGKQIAPVRYLLSPLLLMLSVFGIFIGAKGFERLVEDDVVTGLSLMTVGLVLLLGGTGLVTGNL